MALTENPPVCSGTFLSDDCRLACGFSSGKTVGFTVSGVVFLIGSYQTALSTPPYRLVGQCRILDEGTLFQVKNIAITLQNI